MNIHLDVAHLKNAIVNLLVSYPDLADDMELRADVFEGQTSLHDVLGVLVDREREAKAMAGAIKERIGDLMTRHARYERQQEAWRGLIQKLMDHAGLDKVTLAEATLSIAHRKPAPIIADEAALPDECVVMVRKPVMATIRDWCAAGNIPEGVTMSNGSASLTIRAK